MLILGILLPLLAIRLPRLAPPSLPATYSNPTGSVLTPVRPDVYLAERPFYPRIPGLRSTDVGCKMAVVKLKSGGLWLHSPVEYSPELAAALTSIGPITHIVTPNTEHQKYAPEWISKIPEAASYCCPSLQGGVWEYVIGVDENGVYSDKIPPKWPSEIEFVYVDAESLPIINRPFFNEVIFFHSGSKTLFVTDLWWNYSDGAPILWKLAMDRVYRPVYNRILADRPLLEKRMDKVFSWGSTYIAPCHGEPIEGDDVNNLLGKHLGVTV